MSVSKVCEQCQKEFAVPNRRHEGVKFCSRECKTAAGWVDLKCAACGGAFRRKVSDQKRSALPFCSRACYEKSKPGTPRPRKDVQRFFKVCEACGSGFQVTKTRRDTARWCSRECRDNSAEFRLQQSLTQQAEKSWRWAGGEYKNRDGYIRHKRKVLGTEVATLTHRQVVLQAMLDECPDHPFIVTVNGKKALSKEIEVHHIDRDRSHNERSNLLAVTKDAHARIHHRGTKPHPWECWPPYPVKW